MDADMLCTNYLINGSLSDSPLFECPSQISLQILPFSSLIKTIHPSPQHYFYFALQNSFRNIFMIFAIYQEQFYSIQII
ncbi:hypothetical protein L1887_16887 [Cichorium endivia]|nr:hypothetical protein L1887_16887 [Cichorium endivia]